jgi:TP901 family phage tail tape measure protein
MAYDIGTARGVIEMAYNGRGVTAARRDLGLLDATGAKTLKGLGKFAGAMTGIGLGVATGLAFAIKDIAGFEKELSGIQAVSGATQSEMDAIRGKALQLGADTAFSASEAASAMEELVKAGLSVDEVLNGAADAAVSLAAAGGIDIPQAATIAANAMNQFGLDATDLTGVVDNIAGAANASAIDVSQLGHSLTQVGAVAHLAGLSFEDTATAIALMGNAGIVGSDAGTSLKTMLQNLQPTTKKQIDLFEQLGILTEDGSNKFFDAQGNVKSYAQVAGVLSKALEGQTNQQKLLKLETLFGTDAIRAAAVATENGAKGVRELNKEMGKTTAAEVAAARMDNFSGSLDQLGGSLETALIVGGSGLLVVLRDVVDAMTDGVNKSVELGGVLANKLGPGFNDVIAIIEHVVNGVAAAVDMFDGMGLAIAGMGLEVVIFTFNTLADIIEKVTSLIDGQGQVVAIVAGTWLVLANGGIARVVAELGYFAAYAVVKALDGLMAMQRGAVLATASMKTMAAMAKTAALSLAAVSAIVLAITAWQDYKQAVDETKDALEAADKAKKSGDLSTMQDEVNNLNELIAKRKEAIKEFGDANSWNPGDMMKTLGQLTHPGDWKDILGVQEYKDSMAELEGSSSDLELTMERMGTNVLDLGEAFGLLEPDKAKQLMDAFNEGDPQALVKMDELIGQMQPLLDEAGVSAKDFMGALQGNGDMSMGELRAALRDVTGKADGAQSATESLSEAARNFGNEAATAADKAKELDAALDNLIGVELSADQASINWHNSLRKLRAELDSSSGAILGNSKAAEDNRSLIIQNTEDVLARVTAEAKAGTSIGKITKMFRNSRQELIQSTDAGSKARKEMIKLLDTYNFTPEAVRTIVEAVGVEKAQSAVEKLVEQYDITPEQKKTIFELTGAETAQEKLKALREYIAQLKDKDAHIGVPGADKSADMVQTLRDQIKELTGKDAPIDTPGAPSSVEQVRALKAAIDALKSKSVTITTYIKKLTSGAPDTTGGGGSDLYGGGTPKVRVPPAMLPDHPRPAPSDLPVGLTPRRRRPKRGGDRSGLRLLSGELRLDKSGRAFISGVAADEVDDDEDYGDTLGRMN